MVDHGDRSHGLLEAYLCEERRRTTGPRGYQYDPASGWDRHRPLHSVCCSFIPPVGDRPQTWPSSAKRAATLQKRHLHGAVGRCFLFLYPRAHQQGRRDAIARGARLWRPKNHTSARLNLRHLRLAPSGFGNGAYQRL